MNFLSDSKPVKKNKEKFKIPPEEKNPKKENEEEEDVKEEFVTIKCCLVGDSIGKTYLLEMYKNGEISCCFLPTIYDRYSKNLSMFKKNITLDIDDTSGSESYDRLRPLTYPKTDIFVICFSLVSLSSLENVLKKWFPEIEKHCPGTLIILVGTQLDRVGDIKITEKLRKEKKNTITNYQIYETFEKIGAVKYLECSALENLGVDIVFEEVIKVALGIKDEIFQNKPLKEEKCLIF